MVLPDSLGVPRVPRYSGIHYVRFAFEYGAITLYGQPSQVVLLISFGFSDWTISVSLAATQEISIDFFSSGY